MRSEHVPVGLAVALVALAAWVGPAAGQSDARTSIVFEDQKTSGKVVIVDVVELPQDGFVAVHDPSTGSDDGLGDLLGASVLLGPGQHTDVPVTLERNVTEPTTLVAALYEDANGNGNFDAGHGHGHHHEGEDPPHRDGNTTIGDRARVEPYQVEQRASSTLNPLLVGAGLAGIALTVWAVRFR